MAGAIIRTLEKTTDKLNTIMKYLCVILLFCMMLLGTVDVLGRYLFNSPVSGTYEIFGMLLPALVLLGLAYAQAERAHIRITLLISRLPSMVQRVLGIITTIIMMFMTVLIGWHGMELSLRFKEMGKLIDTIQIPIYIPQLVVPIGAFILLLVLLVQLIQDIARPAERS